MNVVRTRAAISPTGYPHIGTIYQVLFDYAFAKKNQGQFIVRIEDTDQNRLVTDAEEKVFQALDWFGISENESIRKGGPYGPYRQSDRLEIYKKHAEELVKKGQAYYCFCTKERLEEVRQLRQQQGKPPMYDRHCRNLTAAEIKANLKDKKPWVIRLKIPLNEKIMVKDEIRGEIEFDSSMVDDQVLLKSDGYPTYFLAVTVDDHLMKITHMVRGEEWLSSSPKVKLIYDYFGWEKPLFFHTPILRNPDKSKFSKRQGHTSVDWYKDQGFLPEAILNYLALMGWSHPEGKDIFSLEEFIKHVELKDLSPVGPVFDLKKLEWMNGEYIRKFEIFNLKFLIYEFFQRKYSGEEIEKTLPLVQDRMKTLKDWESLTVFFRERPKTFEEIPNKDLLRKIIPELEKSVWEKEAMEKVVRDLAKILNVKAGDFFMAIRDAITGQTATPPILETMIVLGKEESLSRLKTAAI